MFKIASLNASAPAADESFPAEQRNLALLTRFCDHESWSGDLSTGLLRVGDVAVAFHGLESGDCGLLNLVRCYDSADRNKILEIFERATMQLSAFCFATTIAAAHGEKAQPVFCMGESSGLEKRFSGTLSGVFLFPRFSPGRLAGA